MGDQPAAVFFAIASRAHRGKREGEGLGRGADRGQHDRSGLFRHGGRHPAERSGFHGGRSRRRRPSRDHQRHDGRKYWPGENPVGQRISFAGDSTMRQIVGIAKTVNYTDLGETRSPFVPATGAELRRWDRALRPNGRRSCTDIDFSPTRNSAGRRSDRCRRRTNGHQDRRPGALRCDDGC